MFVELEDGVEGLVHLSELVNDADDWDTHYPDNRVIKAEVIYIDSSYDRGNDRNRKISLSERGALERSDGDPESYMQSQTDAGARLGDVMGDLSAKFGGAGEEGGVEAPPPVEAPVVDADPAGEAGQE